MLVSALRALRELTQVYKLCARFVYLCLLNTEAHKHLSGTEDVGPRTRARHQL